MSVFIFSMFYIFRICLLYLVQSQANGNAAGAEEKKGDTEEEEEAKIKLKNQSVLQAKLTKLAIQIGYAGT